MEQYTVIILGSETGGPIFKVSIEEHNLSQDRWRKLVSGLAEVFDANEENVVFGHDYYSKRIEELTNSVNNADETLVNTELEEYSDGIVDGWGDELEECKKEILYELPSPQKEI